MIEYQGQINLPNANIGQTEKTITANEVVRTCDTKALAKEIAHQSHDLITEGIAEMVINSFCQACVEKMSEGFAIQFLNGNDVAMRIFPDVHLNTPSKNINLSRAKELDPTITTEAQMVEKAGELIDKVGLKVGVRAVVQQKFTELLEKEGCQLKRTGIIGVTASGGDSEQGGGDNNPDPNPNNGGGDNGGGNGGGGTSND